MLEPLPTFQDRVPAANTTLVILLLEDRPSDAELLMLHLRRLERPTEVHHTASRDAFEEMYITLQPHLVVSDYNLPDYTGIEALSFVREHDAFIPFVICTGRVNEETAVACLKAGADDYLLKDDLTRVASAISNALENKINLVEKERATTNLRQSEENFRVLAENAPNLIFRVDRNGIIDYANRQFSGQLPHDLVGTKIIELFPGHEDQLMLELGICWAQKASRTLEIGDQDGDQINQWWHLGMGPLGQNGQTEGVILVATDITHQKQNEQALYEVNNRLHQLSQHLETIRDEEKKRISMEIHDQLGQELTAAKLGLYWVQKSIKDMEEGWDRDGVLEKLADLIDLNTQTIQTVRRIAHELRPVVLDNIGLVPALEWHVDMHNKNHQTVCELEVNPALETAGKELSTTVYRIVQEALTNINRHAQASQAWVRLDYADGDLMLEIRDNGVGIDLEKAKQSKSLGLFGIGERLRAWEGSLDIQGTPGEGTRISIRIPSPELTTETT